MKKLFSCILVLALLAAGTTASFAASDMVFEKDATLQNFRNFFNNITVKTGVTLTTKTLSPDPQGIEIDGTLTVEPGGRIVGGGVLIFNRGSECKGMDLYYKVGEVYRKLPENPISRIAQIDMGDPDYRPEFRFSSVVDGWLWSADWEGDPFPENQPGPDGGNQPDPGNTFKDVSENDYFYDAVIWARDNSVTAGVTPDQFEPQSTCTRAQVVSFLWRAQGRPNPASSKNPFTDVKTNNYFYNPVLWAVEKSITAGTTASTFSPADDCTRGQILSFLWRALGKPDAKAGTLQKVTDIYSSGYYIPALAWALDNEMLTPEQLTEGFPKEFCPRADVVYYMYKVLSE